MRKYSLRSCLAVGAVDASSNLLTGAVVARANVRAEGHFAYRHKDGSVNLDDDDAIEELPIYTDDKFIETLLAAAPAPGNKLKVRADHDDRLGARLGYAVNFRRDGDAVITDIKVFTEAKDRSLIMETAANDPKNIGLSIDFLPSFEVREGKAFFRVDKLSAVDIVDRGAITPGGLFLSAREVDSEGKVLTENIQPSQTMPENIEPKNSEIMAALGKLTEGLTALTARLTKLEEGKKPEQPEQLSEAKLKEIISSTVSAELVKRDTANAKLAAKLGFKPDGSKLAAGDEGYQETPKTFDQLKADAMAANAKLSAVDASRMVMRQNPEAYKRHLARGGVCVV